MGVRFPLWAIRSGETGITKGFGPFISGSYPDSGINKKNFENLRKWAKSYNIPTNRKEIIKIYQSGGMVNAEDC